MNQPSQQNKKGGYEAHLTFPKEYAKNVEALLEYEDLQGWVYSVITGCPLLGSGTYCYLTGYRKEKPEVLKSEMDIIESIAKTSGIPILRSKIEHIVFDSKTGVNELE